MDFPIMATIGIVIGVGAIAAVAFYFYRKKSIKKLFEQVYMTSKQVPQKKKNSFLLLMFKESMTTSKKKSTSAFGQLNNPKYLEIQLIKMSKVLKDTSAVKDKKIKSALILLKEYKIWEKEKNTMIAAVTEKKTS